MDNFNPKEYWENRLRNNFGLHGTGFVGLGINYNKWMYKVRKKVILNKLGSLKLNLKDYEVLDIGSGSGFYIDIWKRKGCKKVSGSDLTNISIDKLKQLYPEDEFFVLDIGDELPNILKDRKFDIISAFDILFHIIDDKRYSKAMNNIFSLLKSGGLFIFSENFIHNDAIHTKHQTTRSLKDIENAIISAGFKIINRSPMFYLMNAPIDTNNRILKGIWRATKRIINNGEIRGNIIGGISYPLEIALITVSKEGPSTEIMICRKP